MKIRTHRMILLILLIAFTSIIHINAVYKSAIEEMITITNSNEEIERSITYTYTKEYQIPNKYLEVKEEQERLEQIKLEEEKARLLAEEAKKNQPLSTIPKIDRYSDLGYHHEVSVEQMNKIIAAFNKPNSPFTNNGHVFIKAAEETGLNPIYLFAHASLETGYGEKGYASRHNYFGIGAIDSNPNNAKYMGTNLEEGIVNGAKWIKDNYYDKGYTSLHDMIYTAPHAYASAKDKWINDIIWIANTKLR